MSSRTNRDVYELIESISNAKGPQLAELANLLFEAAKHEVERGKGEGDLEAFCNKWFETEPGYFWMVWNLLPLQGKANLAWSQASLRNLLLLPISRIHETTSEPQKAQTLLRNYFAHFVTKVDEPEKEALVRRLYKAITTDVTETLLKPSPKEIRVQVGASLNNWRDEVEILLSAAHKGQETAAKKADQIDLSLPGLERAIGTRHLIRQTFEELQQIFLSVGFSVVAGPEIETPYYNFEALNIPDYHPARDNMDTFYIEGSKGGHLLRTHTSPMQIRTMEKQPPPVRIIVPGKVYRRDNPDATHGYMFHQIEGLAVDTDITFCDFKGTVDYFVKAFLGPKVKTRLRPSYFPFTEPSAEVDASCHVCGGSGCRVCKQSGWIELFGAGMVNPAVYGFVGYDPERLSGFAFGMGVDRFAMMKYGVTEVPLLFQNDVRFLSQFPY
jgi:phenylalanyl-tRNA synthetase alpha chain